MTESPEQQARDRALHTAANVLQYRQRSARALYDRLLEKGLEPEHAEYAVERLQQLGYLNDVEYGRLLVRELSARGYGAGRIRQELREKKLEPETLEAAMEEYQADPERLRRYIEGKLRGQAPDRRMLKKVSDGLFRRGFSWEEIQTALRRYADQLEDTE